MIVNVKHTVKNAIMVFHRQGQIEQSHITLNAGTMIKVEHVQKQEDNKANLHLINGSVILNVDRDSISFDRDANNAYTENMLAEKMKAPKESQSPSSIVDNVPRPRRGGCCGGK